MFSTRLTFTAAHSKHWPAPAFKLPMWKQNKSSIDVWIIITTVHLFVFLLETLTATDNRVGVKGRNYSFENSSQCRAGQMPGGELWVCGWLDTIELRHQWRGPVLRRLDQYKLLTNLAGREGCAFESVCIRIVCVCLWWERKDGAKPRDRGGLVWLKWQQLTGSFSLFRGPEGETGFPCSLSNHDGYISVDSPKTNRNKWIEVDEGYEGFHSLQQIFILFSFKK